MKIRSCIPSFQAVVFGQHLDRVDQVLLGTHRILTFSPGAGGNALLFKVPPDAPAGAPAPIILGSPGAPGGRRHWIKSQDGFTVLTGTPAGTP